MVADALGVELDEVVCESEFAETTEDLEMASWTIPAGHVAGLFASWQGRVGGRTVVDLNVRWKKGTTLRPDWVIEKDGWVVTVDGLPTLSAAIDLLPPADFEAETLEEFMAIGHIITAVPALNAIPAVVAADPGIVTYADFDFPFPRGWVAPA
jgi:4-hydroxy-tetrahydrodipicolinate reductase